MIRVIKKEEDFVPFQQTFVNVSDTKKEEIHNVSDFSESDPLNTKYIFQIYVTTDYGRPLKYFVIKIPSFWAWTDNLDR